MTKLLALFVAFLVLCLSKAVLSAEKKVQLGICFAGKHCAYPAQQTLVLGDADSSDQPLFIDYKNCQSFEALASPYSRLNSENCVEACDQADTPESCVSIPDNAPAGAAYGCIRRVQSREGYAVEGEEKEKEEQGKKDGESH